MRGFLLSIVCGALMCAVLQKIPKFSGFRNLISYLCAIFLTVCFLKPIVSIKIPSNNMQALWDEGSVFQAQGEEIATKSLKAIITERLEAYILEKAKTYGAEITVDIELSQGDMPQPIGVTINGQLSPYARAQLKELIHDELSIPPEAQTWIS